MMNCSLTKDDVNIYELQISFVQYDIVTILKCKKETIYYYD